MESYKLLYLAMQHLALHCIRARVSDPDNAYEYYRVLGQVDFPYNAEADLLLTVAGGDVQRQTRFGYSPLVRLGGEDGVHVAFVNHNEFPDQIVFQPLDEAKEGLYLWLNGTAGGCDLERLRELHGELVDLPGAYVHLTPGEEVQLIGYNVNGPQVLIGTVLEAGQGGVLLDVIKSTTSVVNDTLWEVRRRTVNVVPDWHELSGVDAGFYTTCEGESLQYRDTIPHGGFRAAVGMYPVAGHKWQIRAMEIQADPATGQYIARNSVSGWTINSDGNLVADQSTRFAGETVTSIAEKLGKLLSVVGNTTLGIRDPKSNTVTQVAIRHGDVLLVNSELVNWVEGDVVIGQQLIDAAM
jgi:hypothetical protein